MTLREQQSIFVFLVANLINYARAQGYELTWGETYRSPEEAKRLADAGLGSALSLHPLRLAVDLNLFIDGEYQTSTEAYQQLGEWWEQQHLLARWGGRFSKRPDGNHFSLEYHGRA
mgnify:CR=1 FL=1